MSFDKLSSTQLLRLAQKPDTLQLRWKADEEAQHVEIYWNYPKHVAIGCSDRIASQFPAKKNVNTIGVPAIAEPKIVTIIGGKYESVRKIFRWALECCRGKGIVSFPLAHKDNTWTISHYDHDAALILNMPWLAADITKHIISLEKGHLQSSDIRELLLNTRYPHEVYNSAAAYIAKKTLEDMPKRRADKEKAETSINNISKIEATTRKANDKAETQIKKKHYVSDRYVSLRYQFPATIGAEVDRIIRANITQENASRNANKAKARFAPKERNKQTAKIAAKQTVPKHFVPMKKYVPPRFTYANAHLRHTTPAETKNDKGSKPDNAAPETEVKTMVDTSQPREQEEGEAEHGVEQEAEKVVGDWADEVNDNQTV